MRFTKSVFAIGGDSDGLKVFGDAQEPQRLMKQIMAYENGLQLWGLELPEIEASELRTLLAVELRGEDYVGQPAANVDMVPGESEGCYVITVGPFWFHVESYEAAELLSVLESVECEAGEVSE